MRLRLSAGAFFQANRAVAELAYRAIARGLGVRPDERIVDAYCGVGGIALALAPSAREVLGIESHAGAIADAVASAALNGATNARFVVADAAAGLAALDRADVVVLNPPRKGCAPAVLAEVVRLGPRAVAYLSCDPDTLARDLALLATTAPARRRVTPFDMLPHNPHVEALALLTRSPNHQCSVVVVVVVDVVVDVDVDLDVVVDADVVAVVHLDAARVGHSGATPDLISTPLDETSDRVGPLRRTDLSRRAREASDRRFVQVHDSDYVSVYDYVQVQVQVHVQVHVHVHVQVDAPSLFWFSRGLFSADLRAPRRAALRRAER